MLHAFLNLNCYDFDLCDDARFDLALAVANGRIGVDEV